LSLNAQVLIFNSHMPTAAYLHIPFCRRRCFYCDFPVSVVGDRRHGENSGTIGQYVKALCDEIRLTPIEIERPLETVFFGGGTPSLLSVHQLQQILDVLQQRFGIAANAEISIEMDPGTFDLTQLQGYQAAGINRVSLGVQAFQDELLSKCGRSHTVAEIYAAVDLLRRANVANFSLDLISGLPHQSLAMWQDSLASAIAISPPHLSLYDMILEPGTVFDRYYQVGDEPLPTDETAAQMYRIAQHTLTKAGYLHYEVSNYARPGFQCRHNRTYWQNRSYYGFGMGATSYVRQQRFARPRTLVSYGQWLAGFAASGGRIEAPVTSPEDELLESLMLGFRTAEGMDLAAVADRWGADIVDRIWRCWQPYLDKGWVEFVGAENADVSLFPIDRPFFGQLRLSDPEGFLFSNTLLSCLFSQLELVPLDGKDAGYR
jgi:putative oxygen-independent coproporphyrinogen III oxidase